MKIILTLILCLMPLMGWGANYYCVAPSGAKTTGANTVGDIGATCYGSIATVITNTVGADGIIEIMGNDTVTAGSTYTYTPATYIDATNTKLNGAAGQKVTVKGRAGDRITIAAAAGQAYAWRHSDTYVLFQNLTFTGGSTTAFRGRGSGLSFTSCNFTTTDAAGSVGLYIDEDIAGLTIRTSNFSGNRSTGMKISTANTKYCSGTVYDSSFNGNGNYGIQGNISGLAISGNYTLYNKSHGIVADASQNSGQPILIDNHKSWDNCDDNTYGAMAKTCTAANSYRHAVVIAGAASYIVKNSYLDGDMGLDIQSDAGYGNNFNGQIYNNVLIGSGTGQTEKATGLFLAATDSRWVNTGVDVSNNTIIAKDVSGAVFVSQYSTGVRLYNNIMYNNAGGHLIKVVPSGTYPTMDYNLFYSTHSTPYDAQGVRKNFADWKTASSQDAASFEADPKLESADLYRPKVDSPARDRGTNALVSLDKDNRPRYWGTGYDIGAYEWSGQYYAVPVTVRF